MLITMQTPGLEYQVEASEPEQLLELLWRLVKYNVGWLQAHPETPHPYQAGLRYEREPQGQENWQSIPVLYANGFGDCEDLACALVAWYLVREKVKAAPVLSRRKRGPKTIWHVRVQKEDGSIEDPSRVLGMR